MKITISTKKGIKLKKLEAMREYFEKLYDEEIEFEVRSENGWIYDVFNRNVDNTCNFIEVA